MRRHDCGRRGRRRRDAFVALVASVVAATVSAPAVANPAETTSEQPRRRFVSVKIAGRPDAVAAVLDVLRERVGGAADETSFEVVPALDRASVVTPGPPNDDQLARIWVDLTDTTPPDEVTGKASDPVTLYVVDGPWERVLVRPVAREANPEVMWEEIGHIVELALTALRAGESIGVGRAVAREQLLPPSPPEAAPPRPADAPSPRRPETPPPRADRKLRIRAGGFYATTAYGSSFELASGPGAMLELHAQTRLFGRPLELGGTVTGEYRFPSSVDRGSAVVKLEGGAIHAMASASYTLAPHHELMLGAGGGVELVHAQASSNELENVRFVGGNIDPIPAARLLARYGWSTSSLRLFGGLGVDLPLRSPRYLLSRENERVVLFEPWVVRPLLLIGIETN